MRTLIDLELLLSPDACLIRGGDGFRIKLPWFELKLTAAAPGVVMAFERMANTGTTEDQMCQDVQKLDGENGLFLLFGALQPLDTAGGLSRRLSLNGKPLVTLTPLAKGFLFQKELPSISARYQLSRFTYLHCERGQFQLSSPLARARLEFHDPIITALVVEFAQPRSIQEMVDLFPNLGWEAITGFMVLLQNAGALITEESQERPNTGIHSPADLWEFHDLLFHMRSRLGRHNAPYGGTYRYKELCPSLIKQYISGEVISLPIPDLEKLRHTDKSFTDVLEQRRTIRNYGPEPISLEQLSEFLYRSARIQTVLPTSEGVDYAFRPTPAGGALHELQLYPVVAQCRGLSKGIYWYNPLRHELTQLASSSSLVEKILEQAWYTADKRSPLNVYFAITARCGRVFWKYESMGYALILKNLGALYTTMYLVATAMGLAPCALGGGDSELFSQATGLDPYEEPAVGEFLLGSREGGEHGL